MMKGLIIVAIQTIVWMSSLAGYAAEPLPIDSRLELADSQEQIGNEIDRIVTWNDETSLAQFAGKPIRLRCVMKDADLFSLQFTD